MKDRFFTIQNKGLAALRESYIRDKTTLPFEMKENIQKHKFCTFWYPTIFHKDLTVLSKFNKENRTIDNIRICDRTKFPHSVSITIDESENLRIESKLTRVGECNGNESGFTVTLIKKKQSKNGFCQYCYDSSQIPEEWLSEFEDILVKDIYHAAKNFYHVHEANADKDSELNGWITEDEADINCDDNKFLVEILEDYVEVFKDYAEYASFLNAQTCEIEHECKNRPFALDNKNVADGIKESVEVLMQFLLVDINNTNELCENAQIEYTYFKTLLYSRYNKSFHHKPLVSEYVCKSGNGTKENDCSEFDEIKNARRIGAINIINSINYVKNIQYKSQNRLHNTSILLLHLVNSMQVHHNDILTQSKFTESISILLSLYSITLGIVFGISGIVPDVGFYLPRILGYTVYVDKSTMLGGIFVTVSLAFLGMILFKAHKHKSGRESLKQRF